ncbi:MAG: type II toxin-antitoxin system VapC family toxin [Gammaproteobacteria bacterium]|nr:type II toxin-antitoxin system VapC family toxin [Gammaproteobacteria bacterium]
MIAVLDASVVIEIVLGTRTGATLRSRLADPRISLHSPELVDLEVLNVLRRLMGSDTVAPTRVAAAAERLGELDLRRHRHGPMLRRIWSWRGNLTMYDAAYVTLAEVLGGPLLTTDGRLANAPGLTVPVEVFATERAR